MFIQYMISKGVNKVIWMEEYLINKERGGIGFGEEKLDEEGNKLLRKTVGQLSGLSTQTRPDVSFDALELSKKLNHATNEDTKQSNKVDTLHEWLK